MAECPDIYINPTYWTTPHPASYGNLAIDVGPAGTSFTQGVTRNVQVTVRNHGTDDSPDSLLQLWWADPSTAFTLMGQIDVDKFVVVPGGDGLGTDGSVTENFSFTPSAAAVSTNAGHVCLLAQTSNTASPTRPGCMAQGHLPSSSAATDARSAVRNIHVYAPSMGAGASGMGEMHFAFAASNNLRTFEDTKLEVRALDPHRDREPLLALARDPAVHAALVSRRVKFSVPNAVLLAEGRERVVLPRPIVRLKPGVCPDAVPRIGRLGPLSLAHAQALQLPGTTLKEATGPLEMHLAPGEMRQTIVQLRPCGRDDAAYVVTIDHSTRDGRPLGGLVLIFVKPYDFF